ncbi:MAG: Ldh family oxidoreductase [Candidatus Aramenus sp.]|nr:Ldh family oxidoreductase [Candidatus Aramenus sp.]
MMIVRHSELRELLTDILDRREVEFSDVIADHFTEAELRGHSSHGVQRMIPLVKGVELGTIRRDLEFEVVKESNSSILIDGKHSVGISLWSLLIEREYDSPVTAIAVRNASHVGYLGYYTERLARKGKVAIMLGNAEPAVTRPGTSPAKVLSTTPFSVAIPSDPPVVLDMALSAIARGKIVEALRKGETIPHGVAVDPEGKVTTNPQRALEGALLPLGGEKGFYLMLTLELLVAFLTGSAVGPQVRGVLNTEHPPNKGEVMIIIDPKYFEANIDAVEYMKEVVGGLLPGEHGRKIREERLKSGIELDEKLFSTLLSMRERVPYFK